MRLLNRSFFLASKGGFTLTEVMIAVGLVGATSLTLATIYTDSVKSNRNIREVSVAKDLADSITTLLSSPEVCTRNFGPAPGQVIPLAPSTTSTVDLVNSTGNVAYDVDSTTAYEDEAWLIKSYTIVSEFVVSQAPEIVIARMELELEKKMPGLSNGSSKIMRSLHLRAELTGPSGTIKSCQSIGRSATTYWATNNGVDIYNINPGNVGIGTTSPGGLLSVGGTAADGGAFTVDNDGNINVTGGTDGEFGLYKSGLGILSVNAANDVALLSPSGKIGIGMNTPTTTLDVNGNIKLGSPGDCDGAHEGATAYNYSSHYLVSCSGSPLIWRPLVGSNNFTSCTPGEYMTGNNSDGSAICQTAPGAACGGDASRICSPNDALTYDYVANRVVKCTAGCWTQQNIAKYCFPNPQNWVKGDDEYIYFKTDESGRGIYGSNCTPTQVDRAHHVSLSGANINGDDRSRACSNTSNCVEKPFTP